jgi:lipopolysaccharide transport system permease protein
MVALLVAVPFLGVGLSPHLLLLVPACALLIVFTIAISLVLSALQVYFRDVRFIATAGLLVWIYLTPVMYPKSLLGRIGPWLDLNPLTGIISLFHVAVVGAHEPWARAVVVSILATAALLVAGIEAHRRHDRLFVDLL